MTHIHVTPGDLERAAASIDVDDAGSGTLPSAALDGAASATPLDGAWSSFLSDAIGAAAALDTVSIDLAGALRIASGNYSRTEVCNAGGLREGH